MRCTINNLNQVNRVLKDKSIYPFITDDGSLTVDEFTAAPFLQNKHCFVLAPNEYSIFMFTPVNGFTCEIHANVVPEGRGDKAVKACSDAINWIFDNTRYEKIISYIPVICPNVIKFTTKVGFRQEGLITKSWKKNGRLHDQVMICSTKEEWEKWQPQQ